jgi:anaerobic magnesium-protoporphyrin IX monomethyl ester cyclase
VTHVHKSGPHPNHLLPALPGKAGPQRRSVSSIMTDSSGDRVCLMGAEIEENLSLRYLAGALEAAGFQVIIVPWQPGASTCTLAREATEASPLAVGVSIPFQHHAAEMMALVRTIRAGGFAGHLTVGGHFATFEYSALLRDLPELDSVVRHEGEQTLVELCERLRAKASPAGVAGLVWRDRGCACVEAPRRLPDLDELPYPLRSPNPHQVLAIPVAPILGSRGCPGVCSFCCIHAYGASARGPHYRTRSPEAVVLEMQREYVERGVRLFVFHDDNFLGAGVAGAMRRCGELSAALRRAGLEEVALVIKCRPDGVSRQLLEALRELRVLRVYIGIESSSEEGVRALHRHVTPLQNRRALELLEEFGLFCSFNLLLFHPGATLEGFEENLHFLENFVEVPFNFCRAEVYAGTLLLEKLRRCGRLFGDYLGWGYELEDPRVELLFRVVSTAFAPRTFKPDGVANLNMGIRFDEEVLRRFYARAESAAFRTALRRLSGEIGTHSLKGLWMALGFCRSVDLRDGAAVKRFTLELAREVAGADLGFLRRIKAARREMVARISSEYGLEVSTLAAPPKHEDGR